MGEGDKRYSGCFLAGVNEGREEVRRVSWKGETRSFTRASSNSFFLCALVACF